MVIISDKLTWDLLYDQIAIVDFPEKEGLIKQVRSVVSHLIPKLVFLPKHEREDGEKMIKGLAFCKVSAGEYDRLSLPELIGGLNLTSPALEDAKGILLKLRATTGNQFIDLLGKDCFTLDLVHRLDYEQIIGDKASNLSRNKEEEGLFKILQELFDLDKEKELAESVFSDYFPWPERNSFQDGLIVFKEWIKARGEYMLVFNPPAEYFKAPPGDKTALLRLNYGEQLAGLIRKLVVCQGLVDRRNYPDRYIKTKIKELKEAIKAELLTVFPQADIFYQGEKRKLASWLNDDLISLDRLYLKLKTKIFNQSFHQQLPAYPALSFPLSPDNIKKVVENAIKSLLSEEVINDGESRQLLTSLVLLDQEYYLDASASPFVKPLISLLQQVAGHKVEVGEVLSLFKAEPYGLNQQLIYMLLVVLTYLGRISLRQQDGLKIGVAELEYYFLTRMSLFSSGLENMRKIAYIILEDDSFRPALKDIFGVLGLKPELLHPDHSPYRTFWQYRKRVTGLLENIKRAELLLEQIRNNYPVLDQEILRKKKEGLVNLPLNRLSRVKTVAALRDLSLDQYELEKLDFGLRFLNNLNDFLIDLTENILPDYLQVLNADDGFASVKGLMKQAWDMLDDQATRVALKKEVEKYKNRVK